MVSRGGFGGRGLCPLRRCLAPDLPIFKSGLRSFAASVKTPKFEATWFGPTGRIFKQEEFSTAFGNVDLARNELKIDPAQPGQFLGRWRVEIRHKGEVIDEREFEIVSS